MGDIYEVFRVGDVDCLKFLFDEGVNVNVCDNWDFVVFYYVCLVGYFDVVCILLEKGVICSENIFDGDRCYYVFLNL